MDVICFSGTGNTRLIVKHITSILSENGIEVCDQSEREPYVHKQGRELMLAFPVNSQAVSPYIWKYIKTLPKGYGDRTHVVMTMNESAAILKPLKKQLEQMGYLPCSCVEISMPNNLMIGSKEDTTIKRLEPAIAQAKQYAREIIDEQVQWGEHKKGSAFVSFLSRDTVLPWITMRMFNRLETDPEKCKKCGACVKECPVGNIQMVDYPVHKNQCEFCMHCAAVCKNDALRFKGKPDYKVRMVSEEK